MKALNRVVELLSWIALVIGGILILLMALIVTYGVFRRYVLLNPEYYSVEISLMIMVWCFVLAAAHVERKEQQIRNDLLSSMLPPKGQIFLLQVFTPIAGLVFVGTMTWRSWINAFYSLQIGEVSAATLWGVPLFPIKIVVPIGYGLLCLVLLIKLINGVISLFAAPAKVEIGDSLARSE
ncbi:MAG: TRAP transporter small permease [Firmicutes bacterium]|jgi:TRAP-type C4-dicarboxylate transport system permease small subunit|nr:TRAP transporter small permease [Bacillota bacterium]